MFDVDVDTAMEEEMNKKVLQIRHTKKSTIRKHQA